MVTNVVNSLWIKDGFSVHDEYADVLNTYYNSTVGMIQNNQAMIKLMVGSMMLLEVAFPDLSDAKIILICSIL